MLERLSALEDRYEKLNDLLADPAIIKDTNQLREVSKEQSQLAPTVEVYRV
ncbi:peptide chain release factor 1, partial [Eggerthella lenta]|nr:peptide chain release factor 1 [Eggerthella lenta]